jgi:hypothetical protein
VGAKSYSWLVTACTSCRRENCRGARFCDSCGVALDAVEPPVEALRAARINLRKKGATLLADGARTHQRGEVLTDR